MPEGSEFDVGTLKVGIKVDNQSAGAETEIGSMSASLKNLAKALAGLKDLDISPEKFATYIPAEWGKASYGTSLDKTATALGNLLDVLKGFSSFIPNVALEGLTAQIAMIAGVAELAAKSVERVANAGRATTTTSGRRSGGSVGGASRYPT